jgi:hypothetical protein
LPRLWRDPGQGIARHEAHGYAVGVMNDGRVVNLEAKLAGGQPCSLNRGSWACTDSMAVLARYQPFGPANRKYAHEAP